MKLVDAGYARLAVEGGARMKSFSIYLSVFVLISAFMVTLYLPAIKNATMEIGDQAANSLLIQSAKHFELLTGNYSRIGFFHPGPAILYTLAAGEWLFFDLLHIVSYPVRGQLIAAALYESFWITNTWWVIAHSTSRMGGCAFLAVYALLISTHEPDAFVSLWFPFLYALPFGCLVVSLAGALAINRKFWLLVSFSAGFLVNGHASFIGITAIMIAAMCGIQIFVLRFGKSRIAHTKGEILGTYIAPILIVVAFLSPLALREIVLHERVVRSYYLFARQGQHHGLTESLEYLSRRLFPSEVEGVLLIVASIYCVFISKRRFSFALFMSAFCATIATLYYVWHGVDNLNETYLVIFYATVPATVIGLTFSELLDHLGPHERIYQAAIIAVCALFAVENIHSASTATSYSEPELKDIDLSINEHTAGKIALNIDDEHDISAVWPLIVGEELYQLRQKGRVSFCIAVNWWIMYRNEDRCRNFDLPTYLVDTAETNRGSTVPGAFTAGRLMFTPVQRPLLAPKDSIVLGQDFDHSALIFGEGWSIARGELVWSTSKKIFTCIGCYPLCHGDRPSNEGLCST